MVGKFLKPWVLFVDRYGDAQSGITRVTSVFFLRVTGAEQLMVARPMHCPLLLCARQNVRVALSNACMKLAPKLGQEHTMTHILPMLVAFLRDESPEVRP